ncbi:MAG: penicillin-binding protein activator [bacterium]|nr:penicillin-binding protein activator [bacterium]
MRLFSTARMGVIAATLLLGSSGAVAAITQIALLLPQSGRMAKAAESIRDGFLAAYYQDTAGASDSPSLRFYDSDSGDISTLVKTAQANGASIIVGPLDREHVEQLIESGPMSIPLLALNQTEGHHNNLFQFALSPDDDVQRLVEWLEQQKIRQPLILGSGDESGQRQQNLFQTAWQMHHTNALRVITLDAAHKGGITAAIRDLTHPPQGYDAIFLTSPALARQVQPALTYYHNQSLLYSLASAWDPTADASGQKDLDGLRFCDLPWMLAEPRPEQNTLYEVFSRPDSGHDRLYAFGADAWTLVRQWHAVQAGEAFSLRSGQVRPDANGRLRRTPTCAEVSNGIATPLWLPESKATGARTTGRAGG